MGETSPFRILAIPGSLRRGSYNRALLQAAIDHAAEGVEIEMYDDLGTLPLFNQDDEGDRTPAAVLELRRRIGAVDGLLVSTPEYNSSIPGVLKNAVDWASRPAGKTEIIGKPAAVMSASVSTFGGVWAQNELRKSLGAAGARVHEEGVAVSKAADHVDADGRLVNNEIIAQVVGLVNDLVTLAGTPIEEW